MEQGRDENRRQQQRQPQQNQKCPRCDSFNTKFCYFNNYSLSQPRHLCKTCKRYWTQGGTFRNIPIGGSSRKAKRARTSSSSSSSSSLSFNYSHPQQPQPHLTRPSPTVVHPTTLGGGYLSSLTGLRSLNPSQPFSESLKAVTGSSNLSLLSGFNAASLTPRFYQIGNRERVNSLFPSEQGLVPSSVGNNSSAVNNSLSERWPQSLVNNQRVSLWSTINANSSISGNSDQNNVRVGSSSFNPNLLPGYGPPPQ